MSSKRSKAYARTVSHSEKVPLTRSGGLAPTDLGSRMGGAHRNSDYRPQGKWRPGDSAVVGPDSARKLNAYLDRKGYSLSGGKGMQVVGFKQITTRGSEGRTIGDSFFSAPGGAERTKQQVAIYAPLPKPAKAEPAEKTEDDGKGRGRNRNRDRDPSPYGRSGRRTKVERLEQEPPRQPDFYGGGNPPPPNPNFAPTGAPATPATPGDASSTPGTPATPGGASSTPTYWDSTAENLFNYADRLGDYNRQTGQWLGNIAAAQRREDGLFSRAFARALPPAPDPDDDNNSVLSFLEQASDVLGLGRRR